MATEQMKQDVKKPERGMFLWLDGIKGASQEPGYEGWLPIKTFQFGMGVAIPRARRKKQTKRMKKKKQSEEEEIDVGEDIIVDETETEAFYRQVKKQREAPSKPSVSEVTVYRVTDASTPFLLHQTVLRKPVRRAIIELNHDGMTLRVVLSSVFISGLSNADDGQSLSLHFRKFEMEVLHKIRRPMSLPQSVFANFDPHQNPDPAFPLPVELLISVLQYLDQTSIARAAMVSKRLAYAANSDLLKVYDRHSNGYDLGDDSVSLDGVEVEPFWLFKDEGSTPRWNAAGSSSDSESD